MAFTFERQAIPDLILIEGRKFIDERGLFYEAYKKSEFNNFGITEDFVQDNYSISKKGVIRGLHYQMAPHTQGKLVQVISGKAWDVAVDIRKDSATFGQWVGVELSGEDSKFFYIPPGFAHGFVALTDEVYFMYKCTAEYNKESERAIRYDDPDLAIDWPMKDNIILSQKDLDVPFLKNAETF